MKLDIKTLIGLVCLIILMLFMFNLGKNSIKITTKSEIKYLPGDTITNEIIKPYPVKESSINIDTLGLLKYCIENNLYSYLIPTVEKEIVVYKDVDTLSILKDWLKLRNYELVIFDNDTIGKLTTKTEIQYNKLKSFNYTFVPISKVSMITKEKKDNLDIILNFGLNTNSQIIFNPNIYFNNGFGFGVIHSNDFKGINSTGIMVGYKF